MRVLLSYYDGLCVRELYYIILHQDIIKKEVGFQQEDSLSPHSIICLHWKQSLYLPRAMLATFLNKFIWQLKINMRRHNVQPLTIRSGLSQYNILHEQMTIFCPLESAGGHCTSTNSNLKLTQWSIQKCLMRSWHNCVLRSFTPTWMQVKCTC